MSVHEEISNWADRLANGSLDEPERATLDAHVAKCESCAIAVDEVLEAQELEYGELVPAQSILQRFRKVARGVAAAFGVSSLIVLGSLFTARSAGEAAEFSRGPVDAVVVVPPRRAPATEKPIDEEGVFANTFGGGQSRVGYRSGGGGFATPNAKRTPDAVKDPREEAARAAQAQRRLIFKADMKIEVDAFEPARTAITQAATDAGGFVSSTSIEKGANGRVRARLEIRIPPKGFDSVIAIAATLGAVRNQTLATEDITKAYYDFESRLKAKEAFAERLRKVLAEGSGTVKELMEVEVQIGHTLEEIDRIKGELRYYDQHIALSTIRLDIVERDIAAPFEYVETLSAEIALVAEDVDSVFEEIQKAVRQAEGDAGAVRMSRATDGVSKATLLVRVPADRYPELRERVRTLGHVSTDTVDRAKQGVGGKGRGGPDAPIRKEEAAVEITLSTPEVKTTHRTELHVQTRSVVEAYDAARKAAEGAGAKILEGSLGGRSDSRSAQLRVDLAPEGLSSLLAEWRGLGEVTSDSSNHELVVTDAPVNERVELVLSLVVPPPVIAEEHGVGQAVRTTVGTSWAALIWSVEMLVVGAALTIPWGILAALGWLLWKRFRRKEQVVAVPAE